MEVGRYCLGPSRMFLGPLTRVGRAGLGERPLSTDEGMGLTRVFETAG